ncbi:hypothetical protein [Deinococcus hopiensis]|uniref:Lipoprotein n=1 Tax=Deinococcus hopiensis KR-140 TaxID=695939 RepID=A0A1W1UY79_9DEIO|nr:hypothetical protein [Deinococcus hopiensis]SMB86075.1 hypothetical protein SAMN00790413_03676 [Deinococcus hopiensis KR-140]
MKFRPASLLLTAALLSGCGQFQAPAEPSTPGPPVPGKPTSEDIVGLLEIKIEGIGEGAPAKAEARFISPTSLKLTDQSSTAVTDTGLNFTRTRVAFVDDETQGTRYVTSVFDLSNTTDRAFANLTLYAVSIPGTTLGGTAVRNIFDALGNAITSPERAQGMLPTHGMRFEGRGIQVSPTNADLQVFMPEEAAAMKTQAAALTPPLNGDVLEYGFVARNLSGGRSIAAGSAGVCSVDACKGTFTIGYKFLKESPRNVNPWAFTLYFVVADETDTRVTVSSEDDPAAAITRANALSPTSQLAVFGTNTATTVANSRIRWTCTLRTAGPAESPAKYLGFASGSTTCNGVWTTSNWNDFYWR